MEKIALILTGEPRSLKLGLPLNFSFMNYLSTKNENLIVDLYIALWDTIDFPWYNYIYEFLDNNIIVEENLFKFLCSARQHIAKDNEFFRKPVDLDPHKLLKYVYKCIPQCYNKNINVKFIKIYNLSKDTKAWYFKENRKNNVYIESFDILPNYTKNVLLTNEVFVNINQEIIAYDLIIKSRTDGFLADYKTCQFFDPIDFVKEWKSSSKYCNEPFVFLNSYNIIRLFPKQYLSPNKYSVEDTIYFGHPKLMADLHTNIKEKQKKIGYFEKYFTGMASFMFFLTQPDKISNIFTTKNYEPIFLRHIHNIDFHYSEETKKGNVCLLDYDLNVNIPQMLRVIQHNNVSLGAYRGNLQYHKSQVIILIITLIKKGYDLKNCNIIVDEKTKKIIKLLYNTTIIDFIVKDKIIKITFADLEKLTINFYTKGDYWLVYC